MDVEFELSTAQTIGIIATAAFLSAALGVLVSRLIILAKSKKK